MIAASRTRLITVKSVKRFHFLSKKATTMQISTDVEFSSQFMVVGLGNHSMPASRHSIGMATIDRLCRHLKATWSKDRDCQGDIAMATLADQHRLILLKPRLLMNINGRSVVKTARKYQVASCNVYLLHDDLDRAFGKFSIKEGGSAGGHNGVKSAIAALGTDVMPRLRIGIGRPTNRNAVTDYVLSGFSIQEKERLPPILEECVLTLLDHINKRAEKT
ncbi:probable peptidyl-tRNA hydrolase [Patiria miniata]|uniref:Peptidyl-tRNA hydrolase n=1 Tax=Patiria miniata TaxID=46514 RepID=A0A914AJU3_PATMI|nr:probable peptidyl-tRNA hydrolase [Patiria miniata]